MKNISCDVAVIGAGPAGLAAATEAKKQGANKVLVIERDIAPGGILQQCIHVGFGLSYFGEELSGPEYATRFIKKAQDSGVEFLYGTMVLEVNQNGTILCCSSDFGMIYIQTSAVVLAMGCRERTRANIRIPGPRPAGIYTAGAAQRLINRQNTMVGNRVAILGSGDIGMIMARRLTLEGAKVVAVIEIMDYLAGLTRNKVQCLDDFDIPLMLGHTVTRIMGEQRVEGVYVAKVDECRNPITEMEAYIPCDTLLLSVGLIPENELSQSAGIQIHSVTNGPVVNQYMQTSLPSIFACGNVVHVNDLADNVSVESEIAGYNSARLTKEGLPKTISVCKCVPGENVRYICPHSIAVSEQNEKVRLYFRVLSPTENVCIKARCSNHILMEKKVLKVNPGEMEYLEINTTELSGDTVRIDVIKEER